MDSVVIVGAGTFGASLAWWLAREGVRVTLVDQFEPGDRRATSGGETRLIRCGHGADAGYTESARRARTLWRELEAESGADLLIECGLAWFARRSDGWEAASEQTMRAQGIPVDRLSVEDGGRLFPSFRGEDLEFVLYEPEAGVLRAQRAIQALAAQAAAHGARVVRGGAAPEGDAVAVEGERLEADAVVWACGGWLTALFPDHVKLTTTRQDLFFLDGGPAWTRAPGWVDYDGAVYGPATSTASASSARPTSRARRSRPTPSCRRSTPPTSGGSASTASCASPRSPPPRERFSTTCRYELSPDSHFVAAPHPEHPSVWLLGGGSGHGFKHGPAMAERMAAALRGGEPMPERFRLGERAVGQSMRTSGSGR